MQVIRLARHRWSTQAWGKQGQSTTGGGVDNRSEASCLVSANPVFLTEPYGVDYWLEVVFLLIGLFETGVVCGRYVSSTYAGSDGYGEATP